MNSINLKKLIDTLRDLNNPFSWGDSLICIGAWCRVLLGREAINTANGSSRVKAIKDFLETEAEYAERLYMFDDIFTGKTLIGGFEMPNSRQIAIDYLEKLYTHFSSIQK